MKATLREVDAKLATTMISFIPDYVWNNPESTFLDISMQTGSLIVCVVEKLKSLGYSYENIQKRVFGFAEDPFILAYAIKHYGLIGTFGVVDALKCNVDKTLGISFNINNKNYCMKFDVVIGNPPYQHPTNKRWKLWVSFIELSMKICKENGLLSLITPISWVDKNGKEIEEARRLLSTKTIKTLNLNANKYFNVGEKIGYFVCLNKESNLNTLTEIFNGDDFIENKKITCNANLISLSNEDKLKYSIISKIDDSLLPRIKTECYLSNIQDIGKTLSLKKSDIFKYKIYHSGSQTYYSSDINLQKYIYPKIIINVSGNYFSEKQPDKYMFISEEEIAGRNATQIRACNLNTAKNIKSFMSSNLYRFYVETTKSSGFNTPLFKLPMLDENKLWTNEDIYRYFNIMDEEIKYIETKIK